LLISVDWLRWASHDLITSIAESWSQENIIQSQDQTGLAASPVDPITALVVRQFIKKYPEINQIYSEIKRVSLDPSDDYLEILEKSISYPDLINSWWALDDSHDLAVKQLEQVEDELVRLFLSSQEQLQRLSSLQGMNQELGELMHRTNALINRAIQSRNRSINSESYQ